MIKIQTKIGKCKVSDIEFLLNALGHTDPDNKYDLGLICSSVIDGCKVLISTDSRRLHMIENNYNVPLGLFRPIEQKRRAYFTLNPCSMPSFWIVQPY